MKVIIICIGIISYVHILQAQSKQLKFSEKEFTSAFRNKKAGIFTGTANGVLLFRESGEKNVILDFQGSASTLVLERDPHEMYDVSYKNYTAFTTSGKTKIEYRNYAMANKLIIFYGNQEFEVGVFDGAYDMVIDGLSYDYMIEKDTEYLILHVEKELMLSNRFFLLKAINYNPDNIEQEVVKKERFIYLQPGSAIVLAISRESENESGEVN